MSQPDPKISGKLFDVEVWALLVVFAVLIYLVFPFVADDAFIVGRYAKNAAAGLGLVYNQGEYVSALTSPLHGLFEVLIAATGSPPVETYRVLAPAVLVLALLWSSRIAGLDRWGTATFLLVSLTSPFVALWTVGGLETPLLSAWVALFAATLMKAAQKDGPSRSAFLGLGVIAGLAFLTRHDSILYFAPPMAAYVWLYWRQAGLWIGGSFAALIAFSWLGFAQVYYGDILPTSAYIKLTFSHVPTSTNAFYTLNFLIVSGFLLLIPILFAGPRVSGRPWPIALRIALVLSAVLFLLYSLRASAQHMMFGYRYFVPLIPAFALFLAAAGRPRIAVPVAAIANVIACIALFQTGLNATPLNRMPNGQGVFFEYRDVTPGDYGAFIDTMKSGALRIQDHWRQKGEDRTPSIWLFTGGSGYFLPDFHVFETLIDYRHICRPGFDRIMAAVDYAQDFTTNGYSDEIQNLLALRSDSDRLVALAQTPVTIGGDVRYWHAPMPQEFRMSARVGDPC